MSAPRSHVSQGAAYAKWAPWCALLLGSVLAVVGVWQHRPAALPEGAAALVNDSVISMQQWRQAISAVNKDRRTPLDAAGEGRVLQTLIDEELLLQLAQDMGLTHSLPEVRGRLVQATMAALSQTVPREPSPEELQDFMAQQAHLFQEAEKRRVRAWRKAPDTTAEALPVPDELMTQRQLQRWLGQSLAEAAFGAHNPGPIATPVVLGEANYELEVLAIEPARPAALNNVDQERALRMFQRQAEEEQLTQALQGLAAEARILRAPPS